MSAPGLLATATRPATPGRAAALPGLAACAVATAAAVLLHMLLPALSPLLIAIGLGAIVSNTVGVPAQLRPGLDVAARRLLRLGVALLGLQLMVGDILGLGYGVVAVVVIIVAAGIAGTMLVGKWLGLSWTQRLLVACGFSICGAAAVAAVGGVVKPKEEETATAIALVVVFGTLMIPAVPALSAIAGLTADQAGMWAGGSIHEVAQVVAAGGAIGGTALAVAVIVKLARVLMLAPVIAVLSIRQRRLPAAASGELHRPPLVPLFVVGFLGCVALRSCGVLPDQVVAAAATVQTVLLTAAMFALGVAVRVTALRSVGSRPFVLAGLSTGWVAAIALAGALIVG